MPKKTIDTIPEFKYEGFQVIVVHKDGKDLKDVKTCYFDSEHNAKKYLDKSKFNKKDYQIYVKKSCK